MVLTRGPLYFDLIATINNKLNASIQETNREFQNIYQGIQQFLRYSQSEMVRMETRMEKMERNINLLTWQNSIEYLDFQGEDYTYLDTPSKIVCLVRDFFDITKGNWNVSDLLLLKTAMTSIDLKPKDKVNYLTAMLEINDTPALQEKLLGGASIKAIEESSCLLSLSVLKKLMDLDDENFYIVDTVSDYLVDQGIQADRKDVRNNLVIRYLKTKEGVNIDTQVECYDLVLDLLYNINQGQEENILYLPGMETEMIDESAIKSSMEFTMKEAETLYQQGKIEEAKTKFKELANQDYGPAMKRLGDLCQATEDFVLANQWYEKAGEADYDWGWYCLGDAFMYGKGVTSDYEIAVQCFQNAYDLDGEAKEHAAGCLGLIYQKYENYDAANAYFAEVGEAGIPFGWKNLGDSYYNGTGVEQNYKKAREYYQKAIDLDESTKGELTKIIGDTYKSQKNLEQAYIYFQKAGEAGNGWGWYELGDAYFEGKGVEENYDKAREYLLKAYDLEGDSKNYAAGLLGIISLYQDEYEQAEKWLQKAEKAACDWAWIEVGEAYHIGNGVEIDYKKAQKCYQNAYNLGKKNKGEAADRIGIIYFDNKSYDNAYKWFKKSAEADFDFGWKHLGDAYYKGYGVGRDYEEAIECYEKGLRHYGKAYDLCKKMLDRLY